MLDAALLREQLLISQTAAAYDLRSFESRQRSAQRLAAFFREMQSASGADAFVEIGAHEASFSREMAGRFPGARVVAFEGSPHNHRHFCARIDWRALGIDYRHAVVSDVDGVAEMRVQAPVDDAPDARIRGDDSLLERREEGVAYEICRVPSVRLDTALSGDGYADRSFALWIDVEGAQRQVLAGAEATLARTCCLMIEVEEVAVWRGQWLFDDVHAHLSQAGFIALARDFETRHQFNVIFVRPQVWQAPDFRLAFTRFLSHAAPHDEAQPPQADASR